VCSTGEDKIEEKEKKKEEGTSVFFRNWFRVIRLAKLRPETGRGGKEEKKKNPRLVQLLIRKALLEEKRGGKIGLFTPGRGKGEKKRKRKESVSRQSPTQT